MLYWYLTTVRYDGVRLLHGCRLYVCGVWCGADQIQQQQCSVVVHISSVSINPLVANSILLCNQHL